MWVSPNCFFFRVVSVPIIEQERRIVIGSRRDIGVFIRKAEGIIRIEPIIVPIARPRAQEGVMYQSLILIIFFMLE